MRIFLAVDIPEDIKKKLAGVQEKLKPQILGVRWEKPEKLHITLVFLGEVPGERIVDLEKAVRKACLPAGRVVKGMKGFKVGFSEAGIFPKGKRPRHVKPREIRFAHHVATCQPRGSPKAIFTRRVVLVGVGEGREEIEGLQKRLAEVLARKGFEFAKLSKPHVTLGRFQRGADATRRVNWDSTLRVGYFRVKEVTIVASKLHPAGAIHTPIARIPLC